MKIGNHLYLNWIDFLFILPTTELSLIYPNIVNDGDDLDTYNGDTKHDMWEDFVNYENIGTPDVFDEPNLDNIIDTLNDFD